MSEMSTLQRTVASFAEEAGIEALVHVRLLDLVSEVGELSKEVLKARTTVAHRSTHRRAGPSRWATCSSP